VEPGKSGFAHFFEHMMFRGTTKYPNYDAETTKMGAFRNASTWPDQTAYYIVANTEYLEKIIDIESDRFMNLKYSEPDFRTEAGSILGEYQQGAREPARWLNEKVRETAFEKHTYRHTTIGFEADVRAMPNAYDYSKAFYERFYRPENVVLVIAGDFNAANAKQLIRKYYAGVPASGDRVRAAADSTARQDGAVSRSHASDHFDQLQGAGVGPEEQGRRGARSAGAGRVRSELGDLSPAGAPATPRSIAVSLVWPVARSLPGERPGDGQQSSRVESDRSGDPGRGEEVPRERHRSKAAG
jgi:hypothetical protein